MSLDAFAFHLCPGNQMSHWLVEGGYDWLVDRLFPSSHRLHEQLS
jgi:hypothetical protein